MKATNEVFKLIKSMSKSEKRFFKMLGTIQSGDKNYLRLFDAIDQQTEYDESALIEKHRNDRFVKHLPSEKNHLHKIILKALRLYYAENSVSTQLADQLQNVEILYNRALYTEGQKVLMRAKRLATEHERFYYLFELLKWEKQFLEEEYQHGRFDRDLDALVREEQTVLEKLRNLAEYQMLYGKINFVFRRGGYTRTDAERQLVSEVEMHRLIQGKNTALSKRAAATCYYIKGLCALTNNQIEDSFVHFSRVVTIFEENPVLLSDIPSQYIKSLGSLFTYHIAASDYTNLFALLKKLRHMGEQPNFGQPDIRIRIFLSTTYFELKAYERLGMYDAAVKGMEVAHAQLSAMNDTLTKEDRVMFDQLFANILFGAGRYREALRQLTDVINDNDVNLRQDIFGFSQLFNLVIHYELGNHELLEYLSKSATRYYTNRRRKSGEGFEFEQAFMSGLRQLVKTGQNTSRQQQALTTLETELNELLLKQNERAAIEYFDYLTWIRAKKEGRSYGEVRTMLGKSFSLQLT